MTNPHYYDTSKTRLCNRNFRPISPRLKDKVEGEIKALLHAHRDTLRNIGKYDTSKVAFSCNDGYYGEAFGVLRGLHLLGYGYFGSSNLDGTNKLEHGQQPEHNLRWWMCELESQVREEEGMKDGTHRCDYCYERYHKDTARMNGVTAFRARVSQPLENVYRKRLGAISRKEKPVEQDTPECASVEIQP